jgi:uncharacterized membrane protein YoaK (UPF0700 family)
MTTSPRATVLATLLSAAAGSADAIGYLGLGGIFLSFMSGNIVLLAVHLAAGDPVSSGRLMAVPVFVAALAVATVVVSGLASRGVDSLRPLLLVEFLLLAGALGVSVVGGSTVVAAMLGVSAMAVQAALTRTAMVGGASTTVMTTNVTRLVMDVSDAVLGHDPDTAVQRRRFAADGAAEIVGFVVGCGLGAVGEATYGLRAMVLPAGLILVALGVAGAATPQRNGAARRN